MEPISKTIYELMNGFLCLDYVPKALAQTVPNEFEEDHPCGKWYSTIYDARIRLGNRLNTSEEDEDIMMIVDAYENIARYLTEKMYEYARMDLEAESIIPN